MSHINFFKNSIITFFAQIVVIIFGFLSLVIISRVLGPEGRGIYSLILIIPALMIAFGNFGIDSSNVYLTGKNKYKIEDIVSNSIIFSALLGIILVLIFWLLLQFSPFVKFLGENKIPIFYLWLVVLSIPISLILSFFRGIICGRQGLADFNRTRILQGFSEFALLVFLLLFFKKGIFGAVLSNILSIVATALFSLVLIKRISRFRFSINMSLLRESFFYGGKVYLANMTSFLSYRIDIFLVALYLNPVEVGLYSIAVSIAEKLFLVPGAFSTVLFPKVSSIKNSEANDLTPKIVRHTFFLISIFSILLAIFAKPFMTVVFGSDYLQAVLPLIVLLPGIIAYGVGGVMAADLSGRGMPQFAIYSTIACLIVNIPLNIIFIPKLGIAGASLASSIAYFIDTLVILGAFLAVSKKSLAEILIIKKDDFKDYLSVLSIVKKWVKK